MSMLYCQENKNINSNGLEVLLTLNLNHLILLMNNQEQQVLYNRNNKLNNKLNNNKKRNPNKLTLILILLELQLNILILLIHSQHSLARHLKTKLNQQISTSSDLNSHHKLIFLINKFNYLDIFYI